MNIRPLYDRIVVKRIDEQETMRQQKENSRCRSPAHIPWKIGAQRLT